MSSQEEKYVLLSKANVLVPASARPQHASTVVRWALRGIGTPRTKLESFKIGGRRYTTAQAMSRFLRRVSEAGMREQSVGEIRSRETVRIERDLDAEGL